MVMFRQFLSSLVLRYGVACEPAHFFFFGGGERENKAKKNEPPRRLVMVLSLSRLPSRLV